MVEIQTPSSLPAAASKPIQSRSQNPTAPPSSIAIPQDNAARLRSQLVLDTFSPVNQNGCFEFDRVIKSGYVQKRTQKTKTWKTIYLVLRPNALSIYKSDKEDKLRHKIYLSELTAVTLLKDPKQKRQNVFGLFSPSKNFHFQATSAKDAQDWVDIIRQDARIEEEEEEIFLASPIIRRQSYGMGGPVQPPVKSNGTMTAEQERLASSSPEPLEPSRINTRPANRSARRISQVGESSGLSGNELASHSDLSDADIVNRLNGASIESLAAQSPTVPLPERPSLGVRNESQVSGMNLEQDPDRVIWQGLLYLLRSKGGLRQWKKSWAVLRPRNLILYRDSSEYSAHLVVPLSSILNVVDLDAISRTKKHCLQIITEEKRFRFCARDEETLLQCLGSFKSLLAKRRELEARAAAATTTMTTAAVNVAASHVADNSATLTTTATAAALALATAPTAPTAPTTSATLAGPLALDAKTVAAAPAPVAEAPPTTTTA